MSEIPINQIICGDCLEIFKTWPEECVVLTDPPYGKGLRYGCGVVDTEAQFDAILQFLTAIPRLTAFTLPSTKIHRLPKFPDWIAVWHKPMTFGMWNTPFIPHWEPIVFYNTSGFKAFRSDVFVYNPTKPNGHPCPKPLDLWLEILVHLPDILVIDPFCGSGTTCVAAKMLGRNYIGIEISEDYCRISRERLAAVDSGVPVKERQNGQMPLFP